VYCTCGGQHWGLHGAAGLLLTDGTHVLLAHRAAWTHQGGSWAVPGGALDSDESPVQAALREMGEETSLDPSGLTPFDEWVDEHGPWRYTTVLARVDGRPDITPDHHENDGVRWWRLDEVTGLQLHGGFAAAWPSLRDRITRAAPPIGPDAPLP